MVEKTKMFNFCEPEGKDTESQSSVISDKHAVATSLAVHILTG